MLVHELSPVECSEILKRSELGRLACAREDQPYIVPIHFSYDAPRHCLYGFSMLGQKILWMRENPKVCVEVEDITDKDHWASVLVFGRYQEITGSPDERASRTDALRLFQRRAEWWLPATAKLRGKEHHQMIVYRVQIDRLTGRRASRERPTTSTVRRREG